MRQTIEDAAKDYAIRKTSFRKNVLKEVDADDYVLREDDCRDLSKDNDLMCNHSLDCNQKCEYMRSFIRLLKE